MKIGKEIKMNGFKDYNVVLGSINNKAPKTNYLNISAWAEPQHEGNLNYNKIINDLNKKIKQFIFNELNYGDNYIFTKDKMIIDLDIRESGVKFGKRSFISCEITLFLITEIFDSELINNQLSKITKLVIDNIFNQDKYFKFHSKKA